jgi:Family of unknown function (DUF5696)
MLMTNFGGQSACLLLITWALSVPLPAEAAPFASLLQAPAATVQTTAGPTRVSRAEAEDWVLANPHLRVHVRPDNLTLSVEDLGTHETWGSDPWENSAGRIHLRSKHGESLTVNLSTAIQKDITTMEGNGENGSGLQISLSKFRSRMGPVREDRNIDGETLSLVLQVWLAKNSPDLTFRIQELHNSSPYWAVETVEWPLRLFPIRTLDDDGYIVFPQEQGLIVPTRFDKGYFRYLNWIWERIAGNAMVVAQSSMPWYGAKKGQSSFICIIETPDDVAYGLIANDVRSPEQAPAPPSAIPAAATALFAPRLSAVWPYWHSVKGELGYPRVAHYVFQPHGGYVEMCKTYRKYAQESGKFVTLKQKIAENPEVAKLIGAPNFEIMAVSNHPRDARYQGLSGPVFDGYHDLQTSFDQIEGIIHDLKDNLGVDRAIIRIAGWGQAGYDNYRPIDELKVNTEAGGQDKLAKTIAAARQAGFLGGIFDNYRNLDMNSPSFDEKYIVRDATGARVPGFTSEGGHSEEICPTEGVKLFAHNMAFYKSALNLNVIYLDTIGGLPLIECYDSRHPLVRAGTREQRLNIMRVATDAKVVLGAEGAPQDWNLRLVDFYDEHPIRLGIDVPLYSLVYHECALLYRQHGDPYDYGMDRYGYVRGPWPMKFLRGLLYGDQSSWTFSNRSYYAWRDKFKAINDVLAPHERRLAHEELLTHQFLTPDFLVQRTTFSSGVEVTVNYGEFPFKLEGGAELPAYGYRVKDSSPNGHSFSGRVETSLLSGDQTGSSKRTQPSTLKH